MFFVFFLSDGLLYFSVFWGVMTDIYQKALFENSASKLYFPFQAIQRSKYIMDLNARLKL